MGRIINPKSRSNKPLEFEIRKNKILRHKKYFPSELSSNFYESPGFYDSCYNY